MQQNQNAMLYFKIHGINELLKILSGNLFNQNISENALNCVIISKVPQWNSLVSLLSVSIYLC